MAGDIGEVPFRALVAYAIGGGWGNDEPGEGTMPVRVIRGTDFSNVTAGAYHAVPRRFEETRKAERRFLQPDDILLEISGGSKTSNQTTGRTMLVTEHLLARLGERAIPASFCRLVRLKSELVLPRYAFYALQEMYRSGRAGLYEHHSTGISNFQFEFFLDQELVRLPSMAEQRAIAHILGTMDDKIELNRRMSETLEAMARALFKSWFVDFDPVRAKAESRDPGLPQPLADLFPARLVDSELGEIPEGWEVGALADLSMLNPEVWSKQTRPPKINYVDLSNTKWGRIEAVTEYEAAHAPSRAQRVLRSGDTIVGTVRPGNGSYAFISDDELTGSTGFAVLRPQTAEYAEFVYLAATAADNIDALAHLADGAAYPAVRPEVVTAAPIVRPKDEAFGRFSRTAGPLLAKIAHNERESRTLAALRDALLPKLISGALRVKDAERFLEKLGL